MWNTGTSCCINQKVHNDQGVLRRGLYWMYTERQKKLITSLEWHSLKSTASKWFIFGHWLCKLSISKKTKVYFNHRGDKCDEIARGKFSKITETACLLGWEFEANKSRYRCLRNPPLKLNVLNRPPPWSSLGEQFLKFSKNYLSCFIRTFLLHDTRKSCVFFRYSYSGVLNLICVQVLLLLIAWILVSVPLKK